jgi:type IV pilus assembly protein PilO
VAKSLHQLSPKAQMVVFSLLSVMTVGAGWQVMISPAREELVTRTERLAEVQQQLTAAQGASKRLEALQREVAQMERTLRQTTASLPDEKDPSDVLNVLHELAVESAIDLSAFAPKEISTKPQYAEWPIELNLEGGYHSIARFFDRVAGMSHLMSVAELHLKTKTSNTGRGTITASCIATTFVFKKDVAPTTSGGNQ